MSPLDCLFGDDVTKAHTSAQRRVLAAAQAAAAAIDPNWMSVRFSGGHGTSPVTCWLNGPLFGDVPMSLDPDLLEKFYAIPGLMGVLFNADHVIVSRPKLVLVRLSGDSQDGYVVRATADVLWVRPLDEGEDVSIKIDGLMRYLARRGPFTEDRKRFPRPRDEPLFLQYCPCKMMMKAVYDTELLRSGSELELARSLWGQCREEWLRKPAGTDAEHLQAYRQRLAAALTKLRNP